MTDLTEVRTLIDESGTYSKSDLENLYEIADTTVYQTLKSCGLLTSRRYYSGSEILNRFHFARVKMSVDGWTYQQVANHFKPQTKSVEYEYAQEEDGDRKAAGFAENQGVENASQIDLQTFELASAIAQQKAEQVAALIAPLMMVHLTNQGETLRASFQEVKKNLTSTTTSPAKLLSVGLQMKQLMPSTQPSTISQSLLIPSTNIE